MPPRRTDVIESEQMGKHPVVAVGTPSQHRAGEQIEMRRHDDRGLTNTTARLVTDRSGRLEPVPTEYARSASDWISALIDRDAGAPYIAVDLWTTARWTQNPLELTRMIRRSCAEAAADAFPMLNPKSVNRMPLDLSVAALVLPAQKPDGVFHAHLFLRLPPVAASRPYVSLTVQTNGRFTVIQAPPVAKYFVRQFRWRSGRYPSSVHLVHDDRQQPVAIDLAVDRVRRAERLRYLTDIGEERRYWGALEFVPGRFWKRLERSWASTVAEHRDEQLNESTV
jgi:hypothetical protein